jgi:tRNA threonylcarbamoyladenosine biosynthesis protein TsaB
MSHVILAMDTATVTASAALFIDGNVIAKTAHDSSGHASELLPSIDAMCKANNIAPAQLSAIAIGVGPGSFTGLRVGMATAKGIAFAAALPLWGVSSLAALALQMADELPLQRRATTILIPVIDARRGEVFVAAYRWVADDLVAAIVDEAVLAPDAVLAFVIGAKAATGLTMTAIAGDGLVEHPQISEQLASMSVELAPQTPCASAVARLAHTGARADIRDHGTPVYIRPSEAEVNYPNGVPGALRNPQ